MARGGFEREPTVVAIDLEAALQDAEPNTVVLALAGGALIKGIKAAALVLRKSAVPVSDVPRQQGSPPPEVEFGLSNYLSSTAGLVDGERITRREVIKYVANVKGGVHLSGKRREAEKPLVARLSKLEKRFDVVSTNGLLFELVAIGQAIAASNDASRFIRAVIDAP